MKNSHIHAQIGLALIGCLFASSAFAYLDPGTGSFVLQMLIAGLLGGLFYIKTAWAGTKAYLSRLFGGAAESETTDASAQQAEADPGRPTTPPE